ncbi:MAG TPA: hypothetical protein VH855_17590 [Acetobacteraceae bacterium]|jgi:hypothetical protein
MDVLARLRAVLPARWFPDSAPVLDGLLSGLAAGWGWIHQQLRYVQAQTRIATATDIWLDIIAQDYFGARLVRRAGQSDPAFRSAIQRELFRERGTRGALVAVLQDLTGRPPLVFEPARPADTGGYTSSAGGGGGVAYGSAGGWGSLALRFQCFVTAYRPLGGGIAMVSGWCSGSGAYGQGAIEYASLAMVQTQVTDEDIYNAVADVLPVATIGWTKIAN